jgi:hypothetical protein
MAKDTDKAAPKQKDQAAAAPKRKDKAAAAPKRKDKAAAVESGPPARSRLQAHFREKIVPDLMQKFGYKTVMQVPRLTKITLNMGVSEAVADKKVMDHAVGDLTKIAGQKPVVTKSRKAIAAFKIRDNVPVGAMVTLRGVRMYEFLDRFVTIALPRVRDHLPRDRVRQDRRDPRAEHQHHDQREDRRRVQGTPQRVPLPVQELKGSSPWQRRP